jgi:hypothetical protein
MKPRRSCPRSVTDVCGRCRESYICTPLFRRPDTRNVRVTVADGDKREDAETQSSRSRPRHQGQGQVRSVGASSSSSSVAILSASTATSPWSNPRRSHCVPSASLECKLSLILCGTEENKGVCSTSRPLVQSRADETSERTHPPQCHPPPQPHKVGQR